MTHKIEDLVGFELHHSSNLHRSSTHLSCLIHGKFKYLRIFHGNGNGRYINVNRIPYNIANLFGSLPISKARYF